MKKLASSSQAPSTRSYPVLQGFRRMLNDKATDIYIYLSKAVSHWRRKKKYRDSLDKDESSSQQQGGFPANKRFLLLCISKWRGYFKTRMIPIDLEFESDVELFQRLRTEYIQMIGPWRLFLSLRCLRDIIFVQVRNRKSAAVFPPYLIFSFC
jgi:hypothetical protein